MKIYKLTDERGEVVAVLRVPAGGTLGEEWLTPAALAQTFSRQPREEFSPRERCGDWAWNPPGEWERPSQIFGVDAFVTKPAPPPLDLPRPSYP